MWAVCKDPTKDSVVPLDQLQLLNSKRHGRNQSLVPGRRESCRYDYKPVLQRRSQRHEFPSSFFCFLPFISCQGFLIGLAHSSQRAKASIDETHTGQCPQAEIRVRRVESDSSTDCFSYLFTSVPVKSG